jgi:MAP kinase interacting serine/threonine kinase
MGVEFGNQSKMAQRPVTLHLGDRAERGEGDGVPGSGGVGCRAQRNRKRGQARVKKFLDVYQTTGETLGEGSFGHVTTYRNKTTDKEFAVKVIEKSERKSRHRVLKEIEIFHHCQGHDNILQMVEYFEEDDKFYLVFEKMEGGTLLDCILRRGHLTEQEASLVVRDIASGLDFLHKKGIAHRDLKPENILCVKAGQLTPVKICDFDLGSEVQVDSRHRSPITTPELLSPVGSADFMAPEVVDVWQYQAWSYDKRCDLWSLGIILYILLCGHRPFYAHCDDDDCGFDDGLACETCQELLFKSIQQGVYTFSQPEWAKVSDEAKDLIQHLLVKNPYQRYTTEQVLRHPWLTSSREPSPQQAASLVTPYMLSRNNSVRELGVFAETANAVNRLIQRHLSINEVRAAVAVPSATLERMLLEGAEEHQNEEDCSDDVTTPSQDHCRTTSPREHGIFQFGLDDDEDDAGIGRLSEEDDEDEVVRAVKRLNLAAPGGSRLAKRRAFQQQHDASKSSVDSGNVSVGGSPPDTQPPVDMIT